MRVLMTADAVGGVWTYALDLAHALSAHNVRIVLAVMGSRPSHQQRRDAAQLANVDCIESSFKLEWMDDPWDEVDEAGEWLLQLERSLRPDIVHLNGYAHAALPWRERVLVVGHSCVLSWWQAVKGEPAPDCYREYRRRVREGLQAADAVVAPTHAMLRELRRHYGQLPRSTVIPNGRSAKLFQPAAKEPIVFAAGRLWDEAKNLRGLGDVAAKVPWPVQLAGETRSPDGRMAHMDGVSLLGCLSPPQTAEKMRRAGIYCLPGRYEPFGLSILEAALCGCALVIGDIPSLREVWGDAAMFVPPGNADALAAALNALIADDNRRADMARRAGERAAAYSPERMARGYLELYSDLRCEDRRAAKKTNRVDLNIPHSERVVA